MFVNKKFMNEGLIMKITKILCHENLELYGIRLIFMSQNNTLSTCRCSCTTQSHELTNYKKNIKYNKLMLLCIQSRDL